MENASRAHKERVSSVFSRTARQFDQVGPRFFSHFGQRLVTYSDLSPGTSVLDIACGRGASLFPAREAVGDNGKVVGIDLSAEMVKETSQETERLGLTAVEVLQMDAEELKFPGGSFDAALCGFGLFFLPNLDKALDEIRRVLKPGGIFGATTFGAWDQRWEKMRELNRVYQDKVEAISHAETRDLNSENEIIDTFTKAGFGQVEIIMEEHEILYRDEHEWWQTLWSHGSRGFLERMDRETLKSYQREAFRNVGAIKTASGVPERFQVILSRARRPKKSGGFETL